MQGIGTNFSDLTEAPGACSVCPEPAVEDGLCEVHSAEVRRAYKAAGFLAEHDPSRAPQDSASQPRSSTKVEQGNEGTRKRGTTAVRGINSSSSSSRPTDDSNTGDSNSPDSAEKKVAEVEQALELYEARRMKSPPVPAEIPLPDPASGTMRAVTDYFALVDALRDDMGLPPEVPFASGWVAEKIGRPKTSVYRALCQLEDCGVLERAGSLESRPGVGMRGTHLWVLRRHLAAVPDPKHVQEAERKVA